MSTLNIRFPDGPTFSRPLTIQEWDFWCYLVSTVKDPGAIEALRYKPELPELQAAAAFPNQSEGGELPQLVWPVATENTCERLVIGDSFPSHDKNGHLFLLSQYIQITKIDFVLQPVTKLAWGKGANATYFITQESYSVCEGPAEARRLAIDFLSMQSSPAYEALMRAEADIAIAKRSLEVPFKYGEPFTSL